MRADRAGAGVVPSGGTPVAWPAWLLAQALVWTLAAWLSRGNLDVPGDMVENYVWGIEWQAGYAKHPPLFAWIAAAWFAVFPRVDGAYFALSALNAAAGLCGVALLARRLLPRDEAALATLALAVSPLYTALAIKFNANAVLLSTWPWAAWGFLALMQGGRLRHALACGVFTALALLGKYFSAVLVLGFLIATVVRPAWRARLRELGPWLAVAAASLVLLPHAIWQIQHDFATFGYAAQRGSGSWGAALARYAKYTLAQVGYLLPSAVLLLLLLRRGERRAGLAAMLRATLRPGPRADVWWLAMSPLLAAGLFALLARTPMASVWGMAQWFAITPLWLLAWRQAGLAPRVALLPRLLLGYFVLVLAGSALAGWQGARKARAIAAEPRAELAAAARQVWRDAIGEPLALVGGSTIESASVAFYGEDAVHWWNTEKPQTTPWITTDRAARDGVLWVCRVGDALCEAGASAATGAPPRTVAVGKRAWGRALPAHTYRLYLQPPVKAASGSVNGTTRAGSPGK